MFRFLGGVVERVVIVVSALAFSQLPLYMQQYEQQLIGRIDELKLQMDAFTKAANGYSLDVYIEKFTSHSDPFFANHGKLLIALTERYNTLKSSYVSLESASVFSKPFLFLTHVKADIASSTWSHFDLGLPLTSEGAVYALIGVLIGMMGIKLLCYPFRKGIKRLRRKSAD